MSMRKVRGDRAAGVGSMGTGSPKPAALGVYGLDFILKAMNM